MAQKYARRHYTDTAEILGNALKHNGETPEKRNLVNQIAQDFSDLFEGDNPRFDDGRFWDHIEKTKKS